MRKTIGLTLFMMVFSGLGGLVGRYSDVEAPAPIHTKMISEQEIRDGVKHERAERAAKIRMDQAVSLARITYRTNGCNDKFAQLTARVALDYGLNPRVLAAVVVAESSARPDAVSGPDIGLMQINTKVWKHYTRAELRDPEQNMRIGARILKNCINQYGLVEGLHAYNGFGRQDDAYSTAVLAKAGMQS
jgi:soluble lytic murein transglycosylase-like protein